MHRLLLVLVLVIVIGPAGFAESAIRRGRDSSALIREIDRSLSRAAWFMLNRQSADGAWRSRTYGVFRDGPTITPHVLNALHFIPHGGERGKVHFKKGMRYLASLVDDKGGIKGNLNYPVLTAAGACRLLQLGEQTSENRRRHSAWLAYLRTYRLNNNLGWKPSDAEFGGWGFSIFPPRKPGVGQENRPFTESNLLATLYGILGLMSARVSTDSAEFRETLSFVKRCQNFVENPAEADPRFDDGGFFFIPGDVVQNKGGSAGKDQKGRDRFNSYGSMTADGIRALIRCGLPAEHPRVLAARKWLETNFLPASHPGTFAPNREVMREATYYYYVWAVSHAFLALKTRALQTAAGSVDWAESLSEAIIRRQRQDGSWINRYTDSREDDPLVSTPLAASALAICRLILAQPRP